MIRYGCQKQSMQIRKDSIHTYIHTYNGSTVFIRSGDYSVPLLPLLCSGLLLEGSDGLL